MAKNYSEPVLAGDGVNDYARYMRTDVLLSLQRSPEEMVHRDELLFQIVHQSTELWLKHASVETAEAATRILAGGLETAIRLLARASLGIELATAQLEMLRHLQPWDFQLIRTVLGHGSGFESPGWREIDRAGQALGVAFAKLLAEREVTLGELYRGSPEAQLYRLAESLVDWDERVSLWRARHYKVATRVIGHGVVGTKGKPVDTLAKLISYKFFPDLWAVRTELTETGPMSDPDAAEEPST